MTILLIMAGPAVAGPGGVVTFVDADTIDLRSAKGSVVRVRIFGIDAPEAKQICQTEQGFDWACGAWATRRAAQIFEGQSATCEALDTDRYNRIVARCAVNDEDIGKRLVQEGLAFAYRKYAMDYDLDEKSAAIADRGLWSMQVQNPAQYRQTRASGRIPLRSDCRIKGNISTKGVKIYHMPGQKDYERTGISLTKGERWFCTPDEAEAEGWRPARR